MPQIYRRHSEYAQRPPIEPRRRSSPQLTDADDSIVLSDLVRTGEASRLRRRGAMRLEHGATRPLLTGSPPVPPSTRYALPPPRPSVVLSTPPWDFTNPSAPGGDDADGFSFSSDSWRPEWRPGEWAGEDTAGEAFPMQTETDEERRDIEHEEQEQEYVLFCGGEDDSCPTSQYVQPFQPSILPLSRHKPASPSASTSQSSSRRSNGCGAEVHMRAIPHRRRGVWQGAAHVAPSDIVVSLDASYFDRGIVAKMLRSACGCVREGIGCAVCGNALGTRYLPCPAASEGIFSTSGTSNGAGQRPHSTAGSQSRPRHPSGPSYWNARQSSPSRGRSSFFVYTFFADHVSSQPPLAVHFSRRPRAEPRREQVLMPEVIVVPSPTLPTPSPRAERQTETGETWYGFRTSASPGPLTFTDSVTEIQDSPVLQNAPLPLTAVDDTDSSAPYERLGGMLDADGELLDPQAGSPHGATTVPNSPDNDKSSGEPVMLPGR